MSDIKKLVRESLSWKKNPEICAKRIGISVTKYLKIRKQVKEENKSRRRIAKVKAKEAELAINNQIRQDINLDKGEARFSGSFSYEPQTAEEIIELLKIDTTKWKLSQYWNKQMSDHWRISALVTQIKDVNSPTYLETLINTWKPKKISIPRRVISDRIANKEKVCGIMSLQDIHFGKEGNETIDDDFEFTVKDLIARGTAAHNIDTLYFVVGGDLINMDTFQGTTTSGTPLDNSMKATEAYIQAFDSMVWAIRTIAAYTDNLVVVYIPGNHDRLSSFHLVHALSKAISADHITWDIEYSERKVHVWHDNFNAFEHGDAVSKNTPIVYATEYPEEWGETKNRTLFTGHFHQNKKIEYITTSETAGFIHKTLPSLSKTDYYHYHKKYVGNRRSGKLELQSPFKGNICELTSTPE